MEKYISNNTQQTEKIAYEFSKQLKKGDTVAYFGSMAMGKTAFTRGILKGLGSKDRVSSPTFSIIQEYSAENTKIAHFDMYRVNGYEGLYSTGYFDYLADDSICIIEWSENITEYLPEHYYKIEISVPDGFECDYAEIEQQRIIQIDKI